MINSIYETLDAYKRQGRINVNAAMSTLCISEVSEARRRALTVEDEFTIDAMALCNSSLGKYFGNRHDVTWDRLRTMFRTCEIECADYWQCKGWSVPELECLQDHLREYTVQCVRALDANRTPKPTTDWQIANIGERDGYDEKAIKWVTEVGPWIFLPQYIVGLTTEDIQTMFKMYAAMKDGFAVRAGDYSHIYCTSEWDYQGIQFSVSYIHGGEERVQHTGGWMTIEEECSKLRSWYLDPANPASHVKDGKHEGIIYAISTNSAIYFYGEGGAELSATEVSDMLLAWTWYDTGYAPNMRVPKYYTGLTFNPDGTVTAKKEVTQSIYTRLGYEGGGDQAFKELIHPLVDRYVLS